MIKKGEIFCNDLPYSLNKKKVDLFKPDKSKRLRSNPSIIKPKPKTRLDKHKEFIVGEISYEIEDIEDIDERRDCRNMF